MANEIQSFYTAGTTLYAVLLNSTGQVWNGTAFATIAAGSWTSYDLAMTEATAGIYQASMPSGLASGTYQFVVYQQAGASPAITDTQRDTGEIQWDGSAVASSATTSYATTAELKTYLGISTTTDDTLLADILTRVKAAIDLHTGRTF